MEDVLSIAKLSEEVKNIKGLEFPFDAILLVLLEHILKKQNIQIQVHTHYFRLY